MKKGYQTPLLALCLALLAGPAPAADDFWSTWGDGRAELNGYELVQPRYGHLRKGYAVLIFVTEDHSEKEKVKIEGDSTRVPEPERFPVLKLNAVRHFQTGIYPYHVLTSVFARVKNRLAPSKISLSVQEWCGQVWHQLVVDRGRAVETLHSYFGGEADQTRLLRPPEGAIYEDQVPLLIRELQGEWLAPGETRRLTAAPALLTLRLEHKPLAWKEMTVTKAAAVKPLKTVLGSTLARRWTVLAPLGATYDYWTEAAWPHRILKWTSDRGESATLTGTTRLPYWKLHDPGDERYLKEIGIVQER
jgi:hypothetical protein